MRSLTDYSIYVSSFCNPASLLDLSPYADHSYTSGTESIPSPRHLFQLVCRHKRIYKVLYTHIMLDADFLGCVMGVGKVYTSGRVCGAVVDYLEGVELLGVTSGLIVECIAESRSLHLGIFGWDYILHAPKGSATPISFKQVDFDTILASFGAPLNATAHRRRHLHHRAYCKIH